MSKITYDANLLKLMTLFETITRTRLKDCFYDANELLTFVVADFQVGKAVGKNASNVKKIEQLLKRKIKIVGFNSEPIQFIKNLIYPIKAELELKEDIVIIKGPDAKTRGFLIGRNQANIKNTSNIVKKYFKQIEIKVV